MNDEEMYFMPNTSARNCRVNLQEVSPFRSVKKLDGDWEFRFDHEDRGIVEGWYRDDINYPDRISVPGAVEAQDLGHDHGSSPHGVAIVRTDYRGRVWYRKRVNVPQEFSRRVVWLNFGGVYPNAWVWVNGRLVDARYCDLTGFSYDVTNFLNSGKENSIVVSVDSRKEAVRAVRIDEWFMPWAGIWRSVELEATASVWIEDLFVIPDVDTNTVRVKIRIISQEENVHLELTVIVTSTLAGKARKMKVKTHVSRGEEKEVTVPVSLGRARLWTPENPHIYRVEAILEKNSKPLDSWIDFFGMRKLEVRGNRILLNNQPLLLRGSMYQFVFPNTISPPSTREAWEERILEYKRYGFNYVRIAGSIAPPEFCDVTDRLGIFTCSAVSDTTVIAPGNVREESLSNPASLALLRRLVKEELLQLRNHPSILMWTLSNETSPSRRPDLPELYRLVKNLDSTRLVLDCDGHNLASGHTFEHDPQNPITDLWTPLYPSSLSSEQMRQLPIVFHEYVNFPTLPNPKTASRYNEVLHFRYIEDVAKWVKQHGAREYSLWKRSSYYLQKAFVKTALESVRLNPDVAGYLMCGIRDADTITYTGILDTFGDTKAMRPREFRRLIADTLLLSNLYSPAEVTHWDSETFEIEFSVSNHSSMPIENADLCYELSSNGKMLAHGRINRRSAPKYQTTQLGAVKVTLPHLTEATEVTVSAVLSTSRRHSDNYWTIWVFPRDHWFTDCTKKAVVQVALPDHLKERYQFFSQVRELTSSTDLLITDHLSGNLDYLVAGGTIWLISAGEFKSEKAQFWPGWYMPGRRNQGVALADHPSLNGFPHRGFVDMQFRTLIGGAAAPFSLSQGPYKGQLDVPSGQAVDLDALGFRVGRIAHGIVGVQEKYDFASCNPTRVAYLFEIGVGKGRLLVNGFNLTGKAPEQQYLFDLLLRYCLSESFAPSYKVPLNQLRRTVAVRMNDDSLVNVC